MVVKNQRAGEVVLHRMQRPAIIVKPCTKRRYRSDRCSLSMQRLFVRFRRDTIGIERHLTFGFVTTTRVFSASFDLSSLELS